MQDLQDGGGGGNCKINSNICSKISGLKRIFRNDFLLFLHPLAQNLVSKINIIQCSFQLNVFHILNPCASQVIPS
jgi:hypothetical protein